MRILFDSKDTRFKEPFGTLTPGQICRLSVSVPMDIKPKEMLLVLENEDGGEYARIHAKPDGKDGPYLIFSVRFALPEAGLYFYYFRIETENERFSLLRQGYDLTNMEAGERWQVSCIPSDFKTPESLYGGVMYQIFPDRFYRAGAPDTAGKLLPFSLHGSWEEDPEWRPDENGEVKNCDFFGGNLAGIGEKIGYLADLGVTVLYLNPIFKAWSNHRYDTADYKKIDELLGSEKDLRDLCEKAHAFGIRVILDGVFSHTGSRSVYFDEKGEFGGGAASDPGSPYRSWFQFQHYPDRYTAWWGVKTLPCVDEMNEAYQAYIISGKDSVIEHWLSAGVDGFRLDVADELPDPFILRLRQRMKEIRSDALLIGEVWEDASNKISYGRRRRYFTDGELDSVMNYPFRQAILDYAAGRDGGTALCQTVMTVVENYPPQVLPLLMNMLSTHDTVRSLSALSPLPFPEDRAERATYKMPPDALKTASARFETATFVQFMLPGMPCVFYGDEIGTEGYEDPFCRSTFRWDRTDGNKLRDLVRTLAHLRRTEAALRLGSVKVSTDGRGRVTIVRQWKDEILTAVVNTGDPLSLPDRNYVFSKRVRGEDGLWLDGNGFVLYHDSRNGVL
ncbi:MAG: glycoside hydrolase family 13 protein [Clostridia bacterium]|nr:glycoside hydrolase family 13 protein [Clostridia bacterium]